jgi:3-carboxy-cis,cis-muconate cycloisomerase
MTASVFDSPMFTKLFPVGEAGRLFAHGAELRAALLVLGTWAKLQATRGDIPEDSGFFIHRSAMEVQIDPAGLAQGMASEHSYVPALIAAFDKAMEAPEHSRFIGAEATPQEIADTALMLRLRQLLGLCETALKALPDTHQTAAALAELPALRATALHVACDSAPELGAELAKALSLGAPADPRQSIRDIAQWLTAAAQAATASTDTAANPAAAALLQQVQTANGTLQLSALSPHAAMSETLHLPTLALGSMALLLTAARPAA